MFKQATDLLGLKPKILTSLAVSLSVLFHCPSVWACPWNSGSSLSYSSVLRADGVLFRVRFTPLKLGGEPAFLSAFLAALSKVSGSTHVLLPLRERPTPQCVSRRGFQRPHQVVRGQREAPADVGHSLETTAPGINTDSSPRPNHRDGGSRSQAGTQQCKLCVCVSICTFDNILSHDDLS